MPVNSTDQRRALAIQRDVQAHTIDYERRRILSGAFGSASICDFGANHLYRLNRFGNFETEGPFLKATPIDKEAHRKAENKAKLLLQNLIGVEQSDIYRGCHRVIVKPSKWFWIIGDISSGKFNKEDPFIYNPDVYRIDNAEKLHVTTFCVMQNGGPPTPFTDKVIAFVTHLLNDEKGFKRRINRIDEGTLPEMPVCAVWNI